MFMRFPRRPNVPWYNRITKNRKVPRLASTTGGRSLSGLDSRKFRTLRWTSGLALSWTRNMLEIVLFFFNLAVIKPAFVACYYCIESKSATSKFFEAFCIALAKSCRFCIIFRLIPISIYFLSSQDGHKDCGNIKRSSLECT